VQSVYQAQEVALTLNSRIVKP